MERNKQIELIRKRNSELTEQLDDLKFKIEYKEKLNSNSYNKANDLIKELEDKKIKWDNLIIELENRKEEYDNLISELKIIKNNFSSKNFRIPLYKKIILKIKNR